MARRANWQWRKLDPLFDEWGHDPQLLEVLADIADTPTNRLPGSEYFTDPQGMPLAILRYMQSGAYRLLFEVDLGYHFNGLAIVHVTRS